MEQKNWKPRYPLKKIYDNNGFSIWQGPNIRDYGPTINRVDSVFYIETEGKIRYAKMDVIKAMEFLYLNMVYEGEKEILRKILRKTFYL